MPPPFRLPPTIPHLTSCWWRLCPAPQKRGARMEADSTPGVLKPVTEKDVVYSPPFPPLAVTPCLPLQPTRVLATGKSHTCPSLTQFLASRKGTTPPNHSDPTPSPRMALLLKLKLEGGNECLPGPRSTLNSVAQQVQDAGSLPAPPALLWGTLPVHQVSSRGGQVPTRHSAQQLQGCLAELEFLK